MSGVKGVKAARFDLIPPEPNWYEALVYGAGAEKYQDRNWEAGYEWGKGIAALERHIQLFKAGEDIDPEFGLPHLAHARWHTGTLLSFYARGMGIDDRTKVANINVLQATLLNKEEIDALHEPSTVDNTLSPFNSIPASSDDSSSRLTFIKDLRDPRRKA